MELTLQSARLESKCLACAISREALDSVAIRTPGTSSPAEAVTRRGNMRERTNDPCHTEQGTGRAATLHRGAACSPPSKVNTSLPVYSIVRFLRAALTV
eukprot:6194528-Pleurochrysis_carterae.AAC.1